MYSSKKGTNGCYRYHRLLAALVLLAWGVSLAMPEPVLAAGVWSPTDSLNVRRESHTATLLDDGTILVAGGYNDVLFDYIDSVERYYPGSASWIEVASLNQARTKHKATLLADGRVLVMGGWGSGTTGYLDHAEIYDPGSDIWTVIAHMETVRGHGHTATRLEDQRVLVSGGRTTGDISLDTAEIFNPADEGSWTSVATPMNAKREDHTATRLLDGRVLVAGGYDCKANSCTDKAQIFDPDDGTWTTDTASLNGTRAFHTATRLSDGRVLVVGGYSSGVGYLNTAEVYDPVLNSWTTTANDLTQARTYHTATLLADGRVLVAGGNDPITGYIDVIEVYHPATNTWSLDAPLGKGRYKHTATRFLDGRVLVAGGYGVNPAQLGFLDSAEIYRLACNPGLMLLMD